MRPSRHPEISFASAERALSLSDLEAYGRIPGAGRERRALCPYCGDDDLGTTHMPRWA